MDVGDMQKWLWVKMKGGGEHWEGRIRSWSQQSGLYAGTVFIIYNNED